MRPLSNHGLVATLAAVALPTFLAAQGRVPAPVAPPRIAVTPALPPPRSGMYPPSAYALPRDGLGYHLGGRYAGDRWAMPYAIGTSVVTPVPVPYPVPVAYAPPPAPRPEPAKPAPPPYDPRKASLRVIGGGADGGGGVMRIERLAADSLRIVWLGTPRPVREARLFVADDAFRPLRSVEVGDDRREGRFRIAGLTRPAAYAGVAIVHADGSRKTVLVPLGEVR